MIVLYLAVLGLCFGSFVNALVWRVRNKKDFVKGRSQCPDCRHTLAPRDLIPVFSWLLLRGRCRYCKKPISWQYPAVEVAGAVTFAASYYFWPGDVNTAGEWLLLITWLISSVGLLALLVYDFRWMLLPNKIVYPTTAVAVAGRLAYIIFYESDKLMSLRNLVLSVAVSSGIFFLLYVVSSGKWIGFGDVRLGLATGALLGAPELSFLMIFLASLLGTVYVLPHLARGKKKMTAKLPYGPFLIVATAISLLFGASLVEWYIDILSA